MLFMVIEHFKNPVAIYTHLRDKGRGMPEGLKYIDSWVEPNFDRCFQLMECDDLQTLQAWMLHWQGLATFEIVPVVTAQKTRETVAPHLPPTAAAP